MNVTNSELRRRARVTLGGKIFGRQWLMGLAVSLVLSAILSVAASLPAGSIILTGPITFGLYLTFIDAVRTKKEITFDLAFEGFKNFSATLLLGLMQGLFVALWILLFVIPGMIIAIILLSVFQTITVTPWIALCFIPGIIKYYSYSMAYYIMADHPEYTWREALRDSKAMMKGNKWKFFCLDFSFIGWYIVGFLCLGVGTLWVSPYQHTAHAEFYNELVGNVAAEETTEEAPVADDHV